MIAASEPQEFVPFGRQQIKLHPGSVAVPNIRKRGLNKGYLAQRLSLVNLEDDTQEFWMLRNSNLKQENDDEVDSEVTMEEELYWSGQTVIISRGSVGKPVLMKTDKNEGRTLVSFSMESPIQQALWCPFPDTHDKLKPKLCILDCDKISVYSDDGSDFMTPLQFKVASLWATKFGLLIERVSHSHSEKCDETCSCDNLTTMFSLLHPLNEISPVLSVKQNGILTYMNDPSLKIIYSNEEPSLCLMYNKRTKLHSIWKIRKAVSEECQWMCGQESGMKLSTPASSSLNAASTYKSVSIRASLNRSLLLHQSGGNSSFRANTSPIHSPLSNRIFTTQSPLGNNSLSSPMNFTNDMLLNSSSVEARLGESDIPQISDPKPIVPELCFEQVWSETPSMSWCKDRVLMAKKAFLSHDILGQKYLCYIVNNGLVFVKLLKSNSSFSIGSLCCLKAKDAVYIPELKIMAVLELSGCVTLYTGTTPIGKLHIAGISAELASVSYLASASSVSTMNTTFPKEPRNSIMSSTRVGDAAFEERSFFYSPVASINESVFSPSDASGKDSIRSLRDPVGSRFTIEYKNGSMFRFTLPGFSSSPLVQRCVKVLKCVLPKDVSLIALAKWYTARNAPGTQDISPKQEWQLFIFCLLELMGYQADSLPLVNQNLHSSSDTPARNTKKMKTSDLGSNNDWNYLMNSAYHESMIPEMNWMGFSDLEVSNGLKTKGEIREMNTNSPLYSHSHLILFSLHLLYEDLKLKPILNECLPLLACLLYQLSSDLRFNEYSSHYWRDYPSECSFETLENQISEEELEKLQCPNFVTSEPANVYSQIYNIITKNNRNSSYPYIIGVNDFSKNILEILGVMSGLEHEFCKNVLISGNQGSVNVNSMLNSIPSALNSEHKAVLLMDKLGMTRQDLLNLPSGLALILGNVVESAAESGIQGWPLGACKLISRLDLAQLIQPHNFSHPDEVLNLRFNKDRRVFDAKKILNSSEPVEIDIVQRPGVSDLEYMEEQERCLYSFCTRTMALPVGRGIMELHTTVPVVITEQLNIPKLCLTGRAPPRDGVVELNHIEVVPNMNLWPSFHNGVASGLKISPLSKNIDSTWILFNKPKNGTDALPEHAGFLMGLGLSGHLNNLMEFYLYNYLSKGHEMTSVGILLGLAASKRGTMDVKVTKLLSLHIESLLPPTSIELNLVQNIQVAALLGIGLVYQGTGHRHIAGALLSEIGRPPGPEMENSSDRECYSLAAGLALGLVVLGKGADPTALADLGLADTLQYYMLGGPRRPLTGSQREKYKYPSYQIKEGDSVNNRVTGPGATLALALMYFNTGNIAVANWLEAPDSEHMLDYVTPDQLLLRTLAKDLVLWDQIIPTVSWVEDHIPETIKPYCLVTQQEEFEDIDLETMSQAYCHIIAGACMALGLRFAGSANDEAFKTLYHYCEFFINLSTRSIAELAGRSTIETSICVILLSLSIVMAGTGNLEVMRVCRYLGSRVSPTNSVVTYGSHLAVHMSLGLLFLGGGALGLSTRPESVAAMICAFFPRFPTHSNDNRYHLQAFRHLYVLAVEPRLFLPKDIDRGSLCYANINVVYLDSPHYRNQNENLFAPCLLPELHLLKEVKIEDKRYWPIVFRKGQNWDHLEEVLKKSGTIGVKLRAGCLPYADDPNGYKTLLAQNLSTDTAFSWSSSKEAIQTYILINTSNFPKLFFLETDEDDERISEREVKLVQSMSSVSYECVTKNKLPLLDYWINILTEMVRSARQPSSLSTWQIRLATAHIEKSHVQPDHILAINQYIKLIFNRWEKDNEKTLFSYLKGNKIDKNSKFEQMLTSYLTFYSFPDERILRTLYDQCKNNPELLEDFASKEGFSISERVLQILCKVYSKDSS